MNEMTPAARRPATYQDVLDAPSNMVAEIVDGSLNLHPRPLPRHSLAASGVGAQLTGPFQYGSDGPGGWIILDEPELHLGGAVLVPDLAAWRRERLPRLPDVVGITVAPDWVCEVLSPSTRRHDLTGKRAAYGRSGVHHIWFLDPDACVLEAFENEEGVWRLLGAYEGAAKVAEAPFEAVPVDLSLLWQDGAAEGEGA